MQEYFSGHPHAIAHVPVGRRRSQILRDSDIMLIILQDILPAGAVVSATGHARTASQLIVDIKRKNFTFARLQIDIPVVYWAAKGFLDGFNTSETLHST